MTRALLKGRSVMLLEDGGGCSVVDVDSGSVQEYSSAFIPLRFQGWSRPEGDDDERLVEEAVRILGDEK